MNRKEKGALAGAGTGAATGAATGALIGSVVPGVGTLAGAGVGGVVGGVAGGIGGYMAEGNDPAKVAKFRAPQYTYGDKFAGEFNPTGGTSDLLAQERALGIQGFDPSSYSAKLAGGLRANVDESTKALRAQRGNAAANSGFLNSASARALDENAIGLGERTYALGLADIAEDSAGRQLTENNNRLGYANDLAKTSYASTLEGWKANEDQRRYDGEALYGRALDTYQLNELDPAERADALEAGRNKARTNLYGSLLSMGGNLGSAAITAGA